MNELVTVENNKLAVAKEVVEKIKSLEKMKLELDLLEKELRQQAIEKMEEYGVTRIIADGLAITYKKASTRTSIDTTRLKKDLPDIAEEYMRTSNTKASVSIIVG